MKKLINAPDLVLAESLAGFAAAHADIVLLGAENKFVQRRQLKSGKVALISGGGSGHEPLHAGFVGRGMLDAACPGQVFTSPTPDQMVAAVEAVETGSGCLFIVKNYEGDAMNFQMAADPAGSASSCHPPTRLPTKWSTPSSRTSPQVEARKPCSSSTASAARRRWSCTSWSIRHCACCGGKVCTCPGISPAVT